MTPEHIEELRKLVIQNSGPTDKTVNLALFGVALEFYNKLERITVAFETIAAASKPIAANGYLESREEFETAVVQAVKNAKRHGINL